MEYYINPNINSTNRIFPTEGRYDFLRLDMNENLLGLPAEFIEKTLSEVTSEFLSAYPESGNFINKYSEYINIPGKNILPVNGADSGIRAILETFGKPGSRVVTVDPTFEMYRINCLILGLQHYGIKYNDNLKLNIDYIISEIDDKTSVVVLINPNNPMGDTYSKEEAEKIIKRAKAKGAIVIIDEAYHYFCDDTLMELVLKYPNVLLLRTFSKLMAMAALRLGVIIGNQELINVLKKAKLTFDVNSIALLFGEALLNREDIIEDMIQKEREGRKFIEDKLSFHGYSYIQCKGNYCLIKTKTDPAYITERLKQEHKILVHRYSGGILKDYIRITTGSTDIMKVFLESFLKVDNNG